MQVLPFAVRAAVLADPAWHAVNAVIGRGHVMLSPMAQFGVLVAGGIVLHEAGVALRVAARALRRWWRRRPTR